MDIFETIREINLQRALQSKEDARALEALLKNDPSRVHARMSAPDDDWDQWAPLHDATGSSLFGSVEVLLHNGADPDAQDARGRSPLFLHIDIPDYDASESAAFVDCVKSFLKFGADPSLRNHEGESPMMIATRRGWENLVDLMLQFGAGMDLNSACRVGNLEVVRTQLAKGEEGIRQAQRPSLLLMDALRLRYCVGQKDDAMKDIIALLLFHGAPVNPELTPLDVGAANLPLHEACSGAVPIEVVRLLLRYGADVTKKNVDGRTPLDIAELRKDQPLCDLLRAHVAECANNE